MIPFVDLGRQHQGLGAELDSALLASARDGRFILGPEVSQFEEEFAAYCGTRFCVGVASGTAALHLGLEALGLGPGDEVIVPANTFVASVLPVVRLGATPVLVDCTPDGEIDVEQVLAAAGPRTRAIVAVHLYGHPADVEPLARLCSERGIALVEDACQAHGARYRGRRAGSLGTFAAFSFYPSKNLGALGDGGAVTTDDEDLARRIRVSRTLGEETKGVHPSPGWNERLDTIQAAVLRVKLRRLDEWNERRRRHAAAYAEALGDTGVELPGVAEWAEPVWHLYPVLHPERDRLREDLAAEGIATGIHYPLPVHLQGAFASLGHERGDFPGAERRADRQVSLPMFPELEAGEIEQVAHAVRRACRATARPRANVS